MPRDARSPAGRPLVIGVFLDLNGVTGHRVFGGVTRWARDHRDVVVRRWTGDRWRARDYALAIDGAIMQCRQPEDDRLAARRGVPMINVSNLRERSAVPRVSADEMAIGREAAAHFLRQGFRHFAYSGFAWHHASALRGRGFAASVRRAGRRAQCVRPFRFALSADQELTFNSEAEAARHRDWLRRLPPRCAVLAFSDVVGQLVLDGCAALGRAVPDDIAVLGVDNDPFRTHDRETALSSIDVGSGQVGFAAAAALYAWLRRGRQPAAGRRVRACRLHVRQSSHRYAVDDPVTLAAIDFVTRHHAGGIDVPAVVAATGVSRRVLERRFRGTIGRSVLQVIDAARLDTARRLLAETDASVKAVGHAAGFKDARHLSVVFRNRLATTPTAYRATHRNDEDRNRRPPKAV